ncbi:hypothetical protein M413DRAFT_30900 [Hebeloma cylindrosporum]|uniref:Uncharacterized protein n=1 Tax=Hebeloma cylindrosporum TaxID=76867 RepID=A0A0C3BZH0_HEBCY|nr:hypothetical protein M413DRAFT_30900 [Hebeloma cylindrosporum h7]
MEGWSKLQSSLGSIDAGTEITKGFNSSVQDIRERLGQVAQDESTELPQGAFFGGDYYLLIACSDDDWIQNTKTSKPESTHSAPHTSPYSIYKSETYDYPIQIQESLSDISSSIGYNLTSFTATNFKGTNVPVPAAPSTLPPSLSLPLPVVLLVLVPVVRGQGQGQAQGRRIQKTHVSHSSCLSCILPSSPTSFTDLDIISSRLMHTTPSIQPEPIKNLNELIKAQLLYFSIAAELLSVPFRERSRSSVSLLRVNTGGLFISFLMYSVSR